MGRILQKPAATTESVQRYIEQSTRDYSTFLNTAPVFCTYFSRNVWKSTHDRSLENVDELVGADSPNQYDRIENLPIYKIENANFGTEITDFGISGNVTSNAVVLPNTILPSVDDFFEIPFNSGSKLFQVTDVNQDNYNNSRFYQISFKLAPQTRQQIEEQVERELVVDYDLIGKAKDPVIEKTKFDLYRVIEQTYDSMLREYYERFFDEEPHCFVVPVGNLKVIDVELNEFISSNGLHRYFSDYRKFVFLAKPEVSYWRGRRPVAVLDAFSPASQNDSLADIIGTKAKSLFISEPGAAKYSMNWFASGNFRKAGVIQTDPFRNEWEPLPSAFYQRALGLIDPPPTNTRTVADFIADFLAKKYDSEEKFEEIPKVLDAATTSDPTDFYAIPLALYALRETRLRIIGRTFSE